MGWANGAHAPPLKDRAAAARLASRGSGRLPDKPRRTQGECGAWSRRHGRRFSRAEDAATRTRQWPIPGLWELRSSILSLNLRSAVDGEARRHMHHAVLARHVGHQSSVQDIVLEIAVHSLSKTWQQRRRHRAGLHKLGLKMSASKSAVRKAALPAANIRNSSAPSISVNALAIVQSRPSSAA